jgi:hypothetical protein
VALMFFVHRPSSTHSKRARAGRGERLGFGGQDDPARRLGDMQPALHSWTLSNKRKWASSRRVSGEFASQRAFYPRAGVLPSSPFFELGRRPGLGYA